MATDYEIPREMLDAVMRSCPVTQPQAQMVLLTAMRWLVDHPIEPTLEQAESIYDGFRGAHAVTVRHCMIEWQRRMFIAKEKA